VKGGKSVAVVALVLLGLLGITATMVLLGRRESNAMPSSSSFAPSGTAAFRQLLDRSGFKTDATSSRRPRLAATDVLVVFDYAIDPEDIFGRAINPEQVKAKEAIQNHLDSGGRVLIFPVLANFRSASLAVGKTLTPINVQGDLKSTLNISSGTGSEPQTTLQQYIDGVNNPASIWQNGDQSEVLAFQVGQGRALVVRDGIFATNRFFDRGQNAEFAMRLIRTLAKPGSNIVFDEAGFGSPVEPGVLETIGPWAEAMWFQLLFLFAVIAYSLGKPFGLPDNERKPQLGTRELLDAVADTFRRGGMTRIALDTAYRTATSTLRNALRMPNDAPPRALTDRLPPALQRSLMDVAGAATVNLSAKMARELIAKLEFDVDTFLGVQGRSASLR